MPIHAECSDLARHTGLDPSLGPPDVCAVCGRPIGGPFAGGDRAESFEKMAPVHRAVSALQWYDLEIARLQLCCRFATDAAGYLRDVPDTLAHMRGHHLSVLLLWAGDNTLTKVSPLTLEGGRNG